MSLFTVGIYKLSGDCSVELWASGTCALRTALLMSGSSPRLLNLASLVFSIVSGELKATHGALIVLVEPLADALLVE
jgi:hypothetical protein